MTECALDGCCSPYRSRGLCGRHYAQARLGKIPLPESWSIPKREYPEQARCTVEGCDTPTKYRASGLCRLHYGRRGRIGSVHLPPKPSETDRFWAKVQPTGFCWEWTGAHDSAGYGIFTLAPADHLNHTTTRSHRYAYESLVGPVGEGLHLDHLCRNRGCCNPDHLEPVTQAENIARGQSVGARIARTGICDRGHSVDQFYVRPDNGHRFCKACARGNRVRREKGETP